MLFSRTPKSIERLKSMVIGDRKPLAPPPVRLNVIVGGKPAVKEPVQVMRDVKDVPKGRRYVPLSDFNALESQRESFAFLAKSTNAGLLLVAEEDFQRHPMFSMKRRLHDAGFTDVECSAVSREIIIVVHDENKDATTTTKKTDVEKAAWMLVDDGVLKGASDIHVETLGAHAQIWFRIHGDRIEQSSMSSATANAVCQVLYGFHGEEGAKKDWSVKETLDTVISRPVPGGPIVQLRWSSGPRFPSGNFAAVMRIVILGIENFRRIEDIGYTMAMVEMVGRMLRGGSGLVILVGPTNSGKSSTMQAMIELLYEKRGRSIKVQTAEDPVEFVIPGAIQQSASADNFGTLVKGMLRQDPDATMVGEVRDVESADNVKTIALTGRKLLTTLHVFEASAAFARLRELGVPESVLYMKGFISGIICQRLVRVICPECSIPFVDACQQGLVDQGLADRVSRVANFAVDNVRIRGNGCKHCKDAGIIGRTPVAEMLVPDQKYMSFIAKGDYAGADAYWASSAPSLNVDGWGVGMLAHALQKMRKGEVSPVDIENAISDIEVDVVPGAAMREPPMIARDFTTEMVGHAELEPQESSTWN